MTRLRAALAAGLAAAFAFPAAAQVFQPVPDRDVSVSYRVTRLDEPPTSERVRWRAEDRRARVELPAGQVSIVDLAAGTTTILGQRTHTYTIMPELPADFASLLAARAPARAGGDAFAGLACTRWTWVDGDTGEGTTACLTPTGVLLELRRGGQVVLHAKLVRFGKQRPALFGIPAGFEAGLSGEGGLP